MKSVIDTLNERDLIAQMTHIELEEYLANNKVSFYIGFDPTADSLHIGHFISMMIASHMQRAGHRPIILVGGATALVGDPSGRTDLRQMLTKEQLDKNIAAIKGQLSKFVSFEGENAAIIVDNADWLLPLNYMEFIRDIGSLFSVNRMLSAECYKQRLEKGLSFLELNYMVMQSYDFLVLYKKYGCKLQLGGNDQWSNIIGGVELIRKIGNDDAFGLTFKLLLTSEGIKMGKTAKGALWLDPKKTSPYEFYQYFRNVADSDVRTILCMLTFLPMDEINKLCALEGEEINESKKIAAFEITKLIHGEEEALKAKQTAEALFEGGENLENMPTTKIEKTELPKSILDILVLSSLAPSKGQGRILIDQGGISIDGNKVTSSDEEVNINMFEKGYIVIKKGKKTYHKIEI